MTVDVIIPVYNGAKSIKRCIRSVAENTFRCPNDVSIRLTLVDDGSTDKTMDVVNRMELGTDFLTVLRQENSGVSAARNRALDETSGDYIVFLDADDWLPEYAIKGLTDSVRKDKTDIAIGNSRQFIGKIPIGTTSETWSKLEPGILNPHDNNFLVEITPGLRAKIFSRKLFERARFPKERIKWEDLAIVPALIAKTARISYVDETVYNYMVHMNTTVKDFLFRCNVLDVIKSLDALKENLQEFGVYDEFCHEYHSILTLHTLFRAENIVTWINTRTRAKRELTRQLLDELSARYAGWEEDPVLKDSKSRYKDPFFNFLKKRLYL